MIRKLVMMVLLVMLAVPSIFAASGPCSNPPSCICNGDFVGSNGAGGGPYGNMNSTAALNMNCWYVSHGTPTVTGTMPGNPGNSIWMWSYSGGGEGVYTCYNFVQNQRYTVCFWVHNTNSITGQLMVVATNGLTNTGPASTTVPSPGGQTISSATVNYGAWTQVTYTFTANANYKELWIYPYRAQAPDKNRQYELQIDDVRVGSTGGNMYISATKSTISGCNDYSTLTVNNAPAGSTINWTPSTGLNTTTGSVVTARPCYTTTYTATIASTCPSCGIGATSVSYTVYVNNGISATKISNNSPVNCGGTISLSYGPTESCATYVWKDPTGATIPGGASVSIANANCTNSGVYTLTITYPATGCVYTLGTTVKVVNCCTAKAGFTVLGTGCNPVQFSSAASSAGCSGTIASYAWDFGDGTASTLSNPTHTFPAAGTYNVCLSIIVKDGNNTCCDKVCKTIQVCDNLPCKAIAAYIYNQVALPANTIQFTSTSTGSGTLCGVYWDFGDMTSSTSFNPLHTYSHPGTFTVCLTIINCVYQNGIIVKECSDRICKQVTVKGDPDCHVTADFTGTQAATPPRTVAFTDGSTGTGTPCSYYWDFGDGTNTTGLNPTHTYTTSGVYTVCEIVTYCIYDINGAIIRECPGKICKQIAVQDQDIPCQVKASFRYGYVITPTGASNTVSFSSTSSGTGTICNYLWDFGDGTTSTAANPTHTYAAPGAYNVCLTVWECIYDAKGNLIKECYDKICQQVVVDNNPVVISGTTAFTYLEMADPVYTINFTDQSSVDGGDICEHSWDFGDQSDGSSDANPQHTYAAANTYTVCETIQACYSDENGTPQLEISTQTCQDVTVTGSGQAEHVSKNKDFDSKNSKNATKDLNTVSGPNSNVTNISVAPNPARSILNVNMTGIQNPVITVTTTDGQTITVNQTKGADNSFQLDINSLKPGVYNINVTGTNATRTVKFVKH